MEFSQDPQGMMVKRFHAGRAAESGVLSARLAQRGLTGPKSALDGKFGYAQVFSREPRPEALTQGLGDDFQIRHNNVKLYACCGALHAGMDIASDMVKRHGFAASDIAEIFFGGNQSHLVRHTNPRPDSVMAAQYSMPYALAVALTGRALDPRMFDEGAFLDPELLRIAALVRVEQHPEVEKVYPAKLGAHVAIRLRDGRVFERTLLEARGAGPDRISRAEIRHKATSLCEPFLRAGHMNALFDRLLGFDQVDDVARLGPWMHSAVMAAA